MERGMKKFRKKQRTKMSGEQPSSQEMDIAKHVRFKTPKKSTVMQKQSVEYFIGSKAVDVLMSSKWANKDHKDFLFATREDVKRYMNDLLQKKFFYRAMKNEKEVKPAQDGVDDLESKNDMETEEKPDETPNTKLRKRNLAKAQEKKETEAVEEESKSKSKNLKKEKEKVTKGKVKKRYKLSVHTEQSFHDSKDIYIWLYNPVSPKTILLGLGVLLCVVAATLFPLWPPQVRVGVYYVSLAGGIFIGSIFVIALLRTILYGVLWAFSGGRHHLWVLPNILADVGFFESFKPFYMYEYRGSKPSEDEVQEETNIEQSSEDVIDEQEQSNEATETKISTDQSENSTRESASESSS